MGYYHQPILHQQMTSVASSTMPALPVIKTRMTLAELVYQWALRQIGL
jgi:hypothetical protein